MRCFSLFLWNKHIGLVQWQWLQLLVSSQGVCQRLLMEFYSCSSFLRIFVHKCTYCQKAMTWIRHDCEVRNVFLWYDWSYKSRGIVRFLMWMSDCKFTHSIWKHVDDVFMLTENGVANIPQIRWLYWQSWNLFSNSFIGKKARLQIFLLFSGLCLANESKYTVICHKLIWHCMVPSLCPGFSPDSVDRTLLFVCFWAGLGWSAGQNHCHNGPAARKEALRVVLGCMQPTGCGLDMYVSRHCQKATVFGLLSCFKCQKFDIVLFHGLLDMGRIAIISAFFFFFCKISVTLSLFHTASESSEAASFFLFHDDIS